MKVMNRKFIEKNENTCKKCGEPLRSTNRRGICDSCRRKRTKAIRETLGASFVIALAVIPGVKHLGGKK